ncbi:MAG: hypothetical protein H7066_22895 [Cytophagaceae bacterium]|nr:hypothetical protein [Gemmatimonadaceae bacterium]
MLAFLRAASLAAQSPVAAYKTEQRYLVYRGMECHFVSYEGQPANAKKSLAATPATWYLMKAGKRFAVMEQVPGLSEAEIDRLLLSWLEEQGFAPTPTPAVGVPAIAGRR